MGVLIFTGAIIGRRNTAVIQVALVESRRRIIGFGRLAQHDCARPLERTNDWRIFGDERGIHERSEPNIQPIAFAADRVFECLDCAGTALDLGKRLVRLFARQQPTVEREFAPLLDRVGGIRKTADVIDGEALGELITEVGELVTNEATLVQILQKAYNECVDYSVNFGAGKKAVEEANRSKNKATKTK